MIERNIAVSPSSASLKSNPEARNTPTRNPAPHSAGSWRTRGRGGEKSMLPVRNLFSLVPMPDHKRTGQIQRKRKISARADVGSVATDAIQRPRAMAYHQKGSP